jgi:hypothetical protein
MLKKNPSERISAKKLLEMPIFKEDFGLSENMAAIEK